MVYFNGSPETLSKYTLLSKIKNPTSTPIVQINDQSNGFETNKLFFNFIQLN